MKLVWSPETALKAYTETCVIYPESSVSELVSAMAAGWNAKLIVETWSRDGVISTSIGLDIAARHTNGRHVCIVPNERSRTEYMEAMEEAGMLPEFMVGEPEEVMERLDGIDFMLVDSRQKEFARILRLAKLSSRGAVLVCKNSNSGAESFRWRGVLEEGLQQVVRSVFLPVGRGLEIAHVATISGVKKGRTKWIRHVDRKSGEEYVIRKYK